MTAATPRAAIEATFRTEFGAAVATLVRLFGDIDVAEEAVQEAFVVALDKWSMPPYVPPKPGGWIVTTAKRKALDRLRRESTRGAKETRAVADVIATSDNGDESEEEVSDVSDVTAVQDDRLRLIFTCCHPALAPASQIALTLRLLGGLECSEIARAFLVPEETMAKRLVRAKAKIRDARVPYRIPADHELPDRLPYVLSVLYLVFNEGYAASSGGLQRTDLCDEAIRLCRVLASLMPDEPEVFGLLGLMLLVSSRRAARADANGDLVLLRAQDRGMWSRERIDEGLSLVETLVRRNQPGQYQIQAAIQAVHASAPTAEATDWAQVLALYDQLMKLTPTPVVALNRAAAVAEVHGPGLALAALEPVAQQLDGYHPFHVARAEFLRQLNRVHEAAAAYERALGCVGNDHERRFLEGQLASLLP